MKKRNRRKKSFKHRKILRRRVRIAIVAASALLILSTLCAATYILIDSLLKVKEVRVTGKSIYTATDIESVCGVAIGDNLLALNTGKISKELSSKLPFIEKAVVKRELPDKLRINVTPAEPVAVVSEGDSNYIISSTGKVLELVESDDEQNSLPKLLVNKTDTTPAVGEQMHYENALSQKIQVDILEALSNNNILDTISTIDLRDLYEIKMYIDGRINVLMGDYSDVDEKIRFLVQIMSNVGQTEKGTVDVSNIKKASFLPEEG